MKPFSLLAGGLGLVAVSSAGKSIEYDARGKEIIRRDVLIIGGGSTGTYGAIKLLDSNKTVLVIEKEAQLGGHTNTYTDSTTRTTVDYGVIVFHDSDVVKKYFTRFNIPLTAAINPPSIFKYINLNTGIEVTNYVPSDPTQGLMGYIGQISQYPYLETGFELPKPMPIDLLLPFNDFLKKYNITGLAQFMYLSTQGLGNFLDLIQSFQSGLITTAAHDNSAIYRAATKELHSTSSLFLCSEASHLKRTSQGVQATIHTPNGPRTVFAKQILTTIPPKPQYLAHYDLDDNEKTLFSKFNNSAYYTGLLRNTGIGDNLTVLNALSTSEYFIPRLPGIYDFYPTGVPGLLNVKYGSPTELPDAQVKSEIEAAIKRLGSSGAIPGAGSAPIEWVAFKNHNPFELTVSIAEIAQGFYAKLSALQGVRSSWWTGAAWHTHDSTLLWAFTDKIVERMLHAL